MQLFYHLSCVILISGVNRQDPVVMVNITACLVTLPLHPIFTGEMVPFESVTRGQLSTVKEA